MSSNSRDKFTVRRAAAFITNDDGGDQGAGGANGGEGSGSGEGGDQGGEEGGKPADPPPAAGDDLATLFKPEEVEARKQALATAKAEEERRAALTDEQRQEEDRLRQEAELADQVPEVYEFQAPEGMTLDETMVGKLSDLARELGLPQAKAQAFVDLGGELVQQVHTQIQDAWEEKRSGWNAAALADKEIGADVAKGADSATARAFATIATPEMKAVFEETGLGDHPEILRVFYRLSQRMKEDGFETGGAGMGLTTKSKAGAMYPTMNE